MFSLRYAEGSLSARSRFMRLCGNLQGRKVVTLNSNPEACARVLASSNTKGRGIELMIACPAWAPVFSIESVDGEEWEWLSKMFVTVYERLAWQDRIGPLTRKHLTRFIQRAVVEQDFVLDAEQISRLTANILFELVFRREMVGHEEDIFYRASLEWRKEIAVKGAGSRDIKNQFWSLLGELLGASAFGEDLKTHAPMHDMYLSLFAQPLILSPQINISDIMAAVFRYLDRDSKLRAAALQAAQQNDLEYLKNICLESIRLNHPFPVLERELTRDLKVGDQDLKAGTQVYIMFDEFKQEQDFKPERWVQGARNPYRSMPFGAGQRMCLGKQLAQDMLSEMLAGMLRQFPEGRIRPSENHLYSGRDNDGKDSLATVLYQLRVFTRVLKHCFRLRKERSPGTCPFTGRLSAKKPSTASVLPPEPFS